MAKPKDADKRPGLLDAMDALEERRRAKKKRAKRDDDSLDLNDVWS